MGLLAYLWWGWACLRAQGVNSAQHLHLRLGQGAESHGSGLLPKGQTGAEDRAGVFLLSFRACRWEEHWGPRAWESPWQGAALSILEAGGEAKNN